jgi:hypothetical protein
MSRDELHELERTVRAELSDAESGASAVETAAVPVEEWLFDPEDAAREAAGLRSLLGAVQALERRRA